LENTSYTYFDDVEIFHEKNKIPLYCRVKITDEKSKYYNYIGEIIEYDDNLYVINLANNDVAGFNNISNFEKNSFDMNQFELLDHGFIQNNIILYEK